MVDILGADKQVKHLAVIPLLAVGADAEDLASRAGNRLGGVSEIVRGSLQDQVDTGDAFLQHAHHVEKRGKDVAGGDDTYQLAVFDHRQAADFALERKLGGAFEGGGRRNRYQVLGHGRGNPAPVFVTNVLAQIAIRDQADQLSA